MTDIEALYDRLAAASSLEGDDAALRITASYDPVGGAGDKISPPTYLTGDRENLPYLFEQRWREREDDSGKRVVEPVRTVLLDSRQSQANRCEEALLAEVRADRLPLPHLELRTTAHDRPMRISSLEAPHRSRDAYFRDATDGDGRPFDQTRAGQELRAVTPDDATALYRYAPTDLVYGVWDSHRNLRLAPRFPRVYTSEIVGFDVLDGRRAAGRYDLVVSGHRQVYPDGETWSLARRSDTKSQKLSALGHGSIPPSTTVERRRDTVLAPGGVTVRAIERTASLGFAGLARLSFGAALPPPAQRAARAVLATLALLADRLAFGRAGLYLRSGCELVLTSEELCWVQPGAGTGEAGALRLDPDTARGLVAHAVEQAVAAGASWAAEPIVLRPHDDLQQVIEDSFFTKPSEEE